MHFEEQPRPALENRISSEEQNILDIALSDGATSDEVIEACLTLYDIANQSRIQAEEQGWTSLMLQESKMGIMYNGDPREENLPPDDVVTKSAFGTVVMHAFTLHDKGDFYSQFVADAKGNLSMLMGMFTKMLKITYNEGGNYYFASVTGDNSEANVDLEVFPYATYALTKEPQEYNYDDLMTAIHSLDGINEIYNMKYCPEIISDGTASEFDELSLTYSDEGYYTAKFAVDMGASPKLLREWFRLPKEDMAVSGQDIESYDYFYVTLEVWDTGYVKSYEAVYAREAGMGGGITTDNFKYYWDEEQIYDIVKADPRFGDDVENTFPSLHDMIEFYKHPVVVPPSNKPSNLVILVILALAVIAILVTLIVVAISAIVKAIRRSSPKLTQRYYARLARKAEKKGSGGTDYVLNDDEDDFTL